MADKFPSTPDNSQPPSMGESWWNSVLGDKESSESGPSSKSSSGFAAKGSMEDWSWARTIFESDEILDLTAIGCNRGGLLVEARSLRGFVPVSHIVKIDPEVAEDERARALAEIVGNDLNLKIIEFDPDRGRLVLSERAALAGPGRRIELMDTIAPGDQVSGEVTNITRFGVFVDLGGVEGLVHVSELSWGRVRHPEDVVVCGDQIQVMVISMDREQGRIALSLKELLPDPWLHVADRFDVGDLVVGDVTNIVKFGAFIGLGDGLEGLIHVSEFGDLGYLQPQSMLREGESVRVRIIHIDPEGRRLGLSLRDVTQDDSHQPENVNDQEEPETVSSV